MRKQKRLSLAANVVNCRHTCVASFLWSSNDCLISNFKLSSVRWKAKHALHATKKKKNKSKKVTFSMRKPQILRLILEKFWETLVRHCNHWLQFLHPYSSAIRDWLIEHVSKTQSKLNGDREKQVLLSCRFSVFVQACALLFKCTVV